MIPPCVFHCRHPSKLFAYGKVKRGLAPHGSICCAEATDLSGGVRSCAHFVVTTRRECVRVSDATHAQRQGGSIDKAALSKRMITTWKVFRAAANGR
jgi:hypothetical protein